MTDHEQVLVEGGALGVDAAAGTWARHSEVRVETHPAQWKRYGNAAGPLRNRDMLYGDDGDGPLPDRVIAFPGGRGTANMVYQAEGAGVPVVRVEYDEEVIAGWV